MTLEKVTTSYHGHMALFNAMIGYLGTLSPTQERVLWIFISFVHHKRDESCGETWPSAKTVAGILKCDLRNVEKAIKALVACGILKTVKDSNRGGRKTNGQGISARRYIELPTPVENTGDSPVEVTGVLADEPRLNLPDNPGNKAPTTPVTFDKEPRLNLPDKQQIEPQNEKQNRTADAAAGNSLEGEEEEKRRDAMTAALKHGEVGEPELSRIPQYFPELTAADVGKIKSKLGKNLDNPGGALVSRIRNCANEVIHRRKRLAEQESKPISRTPATPEDSASLPPIDTTNALKSPRPVDIGPAQQARREIFRSTKPIESVPDPKAEAKEAKRAERVKAIEEFRTGFGENRWQDVTEAFYLQYPATKGIHEKFPELAAEAIFDAIERGTWQLPVECRELADDEPAPNVLRIPASALPALEAVG